VPATATNNQTRCQAADSELAYPYLFTALNPNKIGHSNCVFRSKWATDSGE